MQQQSELSTGDWRQQSQDLRRTASQERHKSEQLAQQLSQEARMHWRKSIEGLLAFPTAAALGIASSTLYIGAFIERGFEIFQQSAEAMSSGMQRSESVYRGADLESQRGSKQPQGRSIESEAGAGDGNRYRAEAGVRAEGPSEAHA